MCFCGLTFDMSGGWKLAGRHSQKVDWRRKPKGGKKAKPKDAATDESEVRFEGRAGGSVEGASWRPAGKRLPRISSRAF